MHKKPFLWIFLFLFLFNFNSSAPGQVAESSEEQLLNNLHQISSNEIFEYVKELASEKFAGRLTGTPGFDAAAHWVAGHFKDWGISPLGDNNTFFQNFPIPYTLVFRGCEVSLQIPYKEGVIKKQYHFDDEFIPGSTSGSGEVTAEVIYAGYGITAPELGYDDYKGIDVKGKIVLIEREVPVSPADDAARFKKWRPYSFHQYKLKNAVKHGAGGMLYNYGPIGNPNNAYDENFIYSHVGKVVVADIFTGTSKNHKDVVTKIKEKLKPNSFATGKIVTIKNVTEYHPEGMGANVLGMIEGRDPKLKDEVIMVGAHLDHLGVSPELMPGANDNASGVATLMGIAKALSAASIPLKRSVLFICFGAEEQAVIGSKYYLRHAKVPVRKTVCFFNLDGVGNGDKISAAAGKNFPELWRYAEQANEKYVHRILRPSYFANLARPRLDAARFLRAGIPSISFSAYGTQSFYHNTKDTIALITPEVMEDLAKILFQAIINIADRDSVNFRK
ncbi:MAG TPA: DUF4910 domain-containing protein [Bacteroidetes bacterium]|nr:DUF4910 domain-containing protein [Bacteroidota bacterium]